MNLPTNNDGKPPPVPAASSIPMITPLGLPLAGNLLFHPQALVAAGINPSFAASPALSNHALFVNPQLAAATLLGLPNGLEMPLPGFVPLPLPMPPSAPLVDRSPSNFLDSVESLLRAAETEPSTLAKGVSKTTSRNSPSPAVDVPSLDTKRVPKMSMRKIESLADNYDSDEMSDDLSQSASKDGDSQPSDVESETFEPEQPNTDRSGYGTRSKTRKAKAAGLPSTRARKSSNPSPHVDTDKSSKTTSTSRAEIQLAATKWDFLELPLPSLSIPAASVSLISSPVNSHESSAYAIPSQTPSFPLIDSPHIWHGSIQPLHTEYLRAVARPTFSIKYHAKYAQPSEPKLLSAKSIPTSLHSGSLTLNTAQTTTKNRKKRVREASEGDGGREDAAAGVDLLPDPPLSKRAKSKEKPDLSGNMDDEDTEEGVKASTPKRRRKSDHVDVKRDAQGNPILPIKLGSLEVLALGKVMVGNERFWTKRYIFPVGYIARRPYYSMKFPEVKCMYVQEVIATKDGEAAVPGFKLTCEDDPNNPIYGPSASSVWSTLIERIKPQREQIVGRPLNSSISGPEQFGFSHPIVHSLIEQLPGASECAGYDPLNFYDRKG